MMDDCYSPHYEVDNLDEIDQDMEEDDDPDTQLDAQTQARLDSAVDNLLKGYNWTLAPLANK